MAKDHHHDHETKTTTMTACREHDWRIVYIILAAITLPMMLTLWTVKQERPREPVEVIEARFPGVNERVATTADDGDPSPLGYTLSLSMWLIPAGALIIWLLRHRAERRRLHKAVFITIFIVGGLGLVLDMLLGLLFFTFPNRTSFLPFRLPAVDWSVEGAICALNLSAVPLEEFGFYFFGAAAIVLFYVWCDEYWLNAYNFADGPRERVLVADALSWKSIEWRFAIPGVLLFGAGWLYRTIWADPERYSEGFPGYLLFLTAVGILPSLLLFRLVKPFINYRALSMTLMVTLFISIFWEALIAIPYQWWGFQDKYMVGITINAFSGTPVEEPMLWVCIVWATIIIFETIYTIQFMGWMKTARDSWEQVRETCPFPLPAFPRQDSGGNDEETAEPEGTSSGKIPPHEETKREKPPEE